jgi:hypothetical protein
METESWLSLGYNSNFGWIKVGANASPMTDQKCRLGSCMIRRLSFVVVHQDGGIP